MRATESIQMRAMLPQFAAEYVVKVKKPWPTI